MEMLSGIQQLSALQHADASSLADNKQPSRCVSHTAVLYQTAQRIVHAKAVRQQAVWQGCMRVLHDSKAFVKLCLQVLT